MGWWTYLSLSAFSVGIQSHTGVGGFSVDSVQFSIPEIGPLKQTANMQRILLTNAYWRGRRDEKPHSCNQCSYVGINSALLSRHIFRMHTNEKPFKCDMCSYAGNDNANLVRHIRIHTGEKPYKCHMCSYTFSQSNTLKHHFMREHSGEKPFRCSICSYSSVNKTHVNTHMRSHIEKVTDSTHNNKGPFREPRHQPPFKIVSSIHQKENSNFITGNRHNKANDIKDCVEFPIDVMERNLVRTFVRAQQESEEWKNIISMIMT